MRESIRQFVKICTEAFPTPEPIYEFGSLQIEGQEGFANLRLFFPNKKYIGADLQHGIGVDVILSLYSVDLPSNSVGTVLVMDTLEHVEYVRKSISEVYRILKPDGIFILSSVMNFPIHDYPHDYWRFTPEAFGILLKPFAYSFVGFAGDYRFPHTVIGIGVKGFIPRDVIDRFVQKYEHWQRLFSYLHGSSKERFLTQFIPPIALKTYLRTKSKLFGVKTCF